MRISDWSSDVCSSDLSIFSAPSSQMNAGSSQAREPHTSADPGKPSGSNAAIKSASPPCGACIQHRTIALSGLLDQGCVSAGFSPRPLFEGLAETYLGIEAFYGLLGTWLLWVWV